MKHNSQLRLRPLKSPSLVWTVIPWESWEQRCWDRVREVQLTRFRNQHPSIEDSIEEFLVSYTVTKLYEDLGHNLGIRRISKRHIPENINEYDNIVDVLDSVIYSDNEDYPDNPSEEVEVGMERIQKLYDFLDQDYEDLTLVRDPETREGMKILDATDTMVDDLEVYDKKEMPSITLCKKLEDGIKEDYRGYSGRRKTQKAVSQFRHAEQLNRRDVHLVKRPLTQRDGLISELFS